MRKWWRRKIDRWASQFLYSLSDSEFDNWIGNIRFYRTLQKQLVLTNFAEPRPLPEATGDLITLKFPTSWDKN